MKSTPRDPFALHMQPPNKGDRIVIGAYITKPMAEQIALCSLHSGVSRSKFIDSALCYYLKSIRTNTEDIIFQLSRRAAAEWDSFCRANTGKDGWNEKEQFLEYQRTIKNSLKKRGIPQDIIKKVVERI